MAYVAKNLGRVTSSGNSNHPTIWSYNAGADTYATVTGATHWVTAISDGLVKVGDIIIVTYASNAKCTLVVVTSTAGASVPLATTSATTNT